MISHLGFFWTDKNDPEAAERLVKAAKDLLSDIPGANNFHAGAAMSSPRGVVDDTFKLGISMQFEDEAALKAYAVHPNHLKFVDEYVKKDVRRFIIYDIEG